MNRKNCLILPCLVSPMVLSCFMEGQGGMRMTWQERSEVTGSGLGSGTGLLLQIRRQERGLVTHCQQITALNHNLHLCDKSLSTAACTFEDPSHCRKLEYGSILSYWPWADDRDFTSSISFIQFSLSSIFASHDHVNRASVEVRCTPVILFKLHTTSCHVTCCLPLRDTVFIIVVLHHTVSSHNNNSNKSEKRGKSAR